jgi:regulator of PEP synthase PpsR (kinase-PPPase family)
MSRHDSRTIDRPYRAIEEIAREVLRLRDQPEHAVG